MKEVCTNQGFQSILVNKNNNNEFIYYLLDTLKGELVRQSSGSTFLEISGRKLGNISSAFPNIEEQKKIAV
jgi:type I restriction enzyme S subunit